MAAGHTDAVFEKTAKFLGNMEPRLPWRKVHRRATEKTTASEESGVPCKRHNHPSSNPKIKF